MSTFGTGTFGSGTFGDPAPAQTVTFTDGAPVAVAVDAPTVTFVATYAGTAEPGDLTVTIGSDAPGITAAITVTMTDGIAETVATADPTATFSTSPDRDAIFTDGIGEPIAVDAPAALTIVDTGDGPGIDVAVDAPAVSFTLAPIEPDGIAVTCNTSAPTVSFAIAVTGLGELGEQVEVDAPTAAFGMYTNPGDLTIDVTPGGLNSIGVDLTVSMTDGVAVPIGIDAPTALRDPALPPGIGEPISMDAPTVAWSAAVAIPDGIGEPVDTGAPLMGILIALGDGISIGISQDGPTSAWANTVTIIGITEPLTTAEPIITKPAPPWMTPPVLPGGDGYGQQETSLLPLHLLGIGPTDAGVPWRGAPNAGVTGGRISRPAMPAIQMPEAQTKTFTLRLNAGGEASVSHAFARTDAVVIEEMLTDLWWRRRDPHTGIVENIGRFNADKVDVASAGTGLNVSVNWADYRSLLEARLILTYKSPLLVPPQSQWAKATAVTEILRFIIPTNTNLDISNIDVGAMNLGVTTEVCELIPGTTVKEAMDTVNNISATPWEWWVDMPDDITAAPKLMFAVGERGTDRGITLFDTDGLHGPIASWTMQAAAESYANALFYSGSEGGWVLVLDDEISTYGQRDAMDSDSSLGGVELLIKAAGRKKLAQLASRIPTYTLVLRQGFWEGRGHIDVGDYITLNIALGDDAIAGKYRVQEINGEVDASGMETITLTLGTARPAKDPRSRLSATARIVRALKNTERKGT